MKMNVRSFIHTIAGVAAVAFITTCLPAGALAEPGAKLKDKGLKGTLKVANFDNTADIAEAANAIVVFEVCVNSATSALNYDRGGGLTTWNVGNITGGACKQFEPGVGFPANSSFQALGGSATLYYLLTSDL